VADFLVEAGGDLYAGGRRAGRPWEIGIRDPRGAPGSRIATLYVSDEAVSTAGDHEHFLVERGRRYHVIDPRTCRPAQASRAATVVAARAVDSEILSNAVFVAGGRRGLRLAAQEAARALVVTAQGELLSSPGLAMERTGRRPASGTAGGTSAVGP
jgi:thiamine biosynthesis lipoprotein